MLTKLEAVNILLDAVGEAPVSSLSSGLPEAADAERILDRASHRVQMSGWHCNTDYGYTIAMNADGTIPVASDILRVDTYDTDAYKNVTTRYLANDRLLYDIDNRTHTFTKAPKLQVVWHLDFAKLTPTLQEYIAAEAAVEYQTSELGSVALDSMVSRRKAEAWTALIDEELENEDANPLNDAASLQWATHRNSPAKNGWL